MNASSDRPALRINSVAGLLASIPHLLGFTPNTSLVVLGAAAAAADPGHVPLRPARSARPGARHDIAAHAVSVLARQKLTIAIAVGYGPAGWSTPLADALRARRAA